MDGVGIVYRTFVAPLLNGECAYNSGDDPYSHSLTSSRIVRTPFGGERQIYWLDELLHGGIYVSSELGRPLRVLVTGPPGVGKSLLVQQICCGRSIAQAINAEPKTGDRNDLTKHRSVILSLEAEPKAAVENLCRLQWPLEIGPKPIMWADGTSPPRETPGVSFLRSKLKNDIRGRGLTETPKIEELAAFLASTIKAQGAELGIVGLDGLNSLFRPESQVAIIQHVSDIVGAVVPYPPIMFFVFDTAGGQFDYRSNALAYLADIVIELSILSTPSAAGYEDRYIEITKARYQEVVKGKHLVKIIPLSEKNILSNNDLSGPRPVLREGGFFVFPSIHYVLGYQRLEQPFVDHSPRVQAIQKAVDATRKSVTDTNDNWIEVVGTWNGDTSKPLLQGDAQSRSALYSYGPPVFAHKPIEIFRAHNFGLPWPVGDIADVVGRGMAAGKSTLFLGRPSDGVDLLGRRFARDGLCGSYIDGAEDVLVLSFGVVPKDDIQARTIALVQKHFQDHWATSQMKKSCLFRDHPYPKAERLRQFQQSDQFAEFKQAISRLTVVSQKPGMVTPEEVLHRLAYWLSVKDVGRVLVRGVDEFAILYPRLSESKLFFPAVVDLCQRHYATTLFTVSDARQGATDIDDDGHGLRALAETVVVVKVSGGRSIQSEKRSHFRVALDVNVTKIGRGGRPLARQQPIELFFDRDSEADRVWRWVPRKRVAAKGA